jgi:hypothetical protein
MSCYKTVTYVLITPAGLSHNGSHTRRLRALEKVYFFLASKCAELFVFLLRPTLQKVRLSTARSEARTERNWYDLLCDEPAVGHTNSYLSHNHRYTFSISPEASDHRNANNKNHKKNNENLYMTNVTFL